VRAEEGFGPPQDSALLTLLECVFQGVHPLRCLQSGTSLVLRRDPLLKKGAPVWVHVDPEGEHGSAETNRAGACFVVARAGWDWQRAVAGCPSDVRHERKRVHPASLKVLLQRPPIPLVVR
jgi:hypothetical protein